jgi:hypothetical protein
MLENLKKASSMEKENGRNRQTHMCHATLMKVTTLTIERTDTEYFLGRVATSTKEIIKMMSVTAMERCSGQTAQSTRASGGKGFSMGSER